jgi:hypothetical protein
VPQYDRAESFRNGVAEVALGGATYLVDRDGGVVQELTARRSVQATEVLSEEGSAEDEEFAGDPLTDLQLPGSEDDGSFDDEAPIGAPLEIPM